MMLIPLESLTSWPLLVCADPLADKGAVPYKGLTGLLSPVKTAAVLSWCARPSLTMLLSPAHGGFLSAGGNETPASKHVFGTLHYPGFGAIHDSVVVCTCGP